MKNFFWILILSLLVACSDTVNRPKNLVDKETMSKIIADFAINDQMGTLNQKGNLETSSRYILKKYKIKGKDFSDSYTFYLSEPKTLEKILKKSQDIIKEKDPAAATYIKDRIKKEKHNGFSENENE